MSECLDDIVQLRDDDSDTLETVEGSDDEGDQLAELDIDSESRLEQTVLDLRWKMQNSLLTNTQLELERINMRQVRELETLQTGCDLTRDCFKSWQAQVPSRMDLLKHQLIEEFEMVCHKEKLTVFLLCGEIRKYIKSL